jgi:hypothetical protein
MGVLDPDASSPSDPGVNGSLTPFTTIYDNGYFSNEQEPLTWETEFNKLYNEYKQTRDLVDIVEFRNSALGESEDIGVTKTAAGILGNMVTTLARTEMERSIMNNPIDSVTGDKLNYKLDESGLIVYE